MTDNNLKIVNNFRDMKEYLTVKGGSHKAYKHYTNIDGLLGILRSKSVHLSSLNNSKMNDLLEQTKGNLKQRERSYEMSFAFGNTENMAMWGLYSLPYKEAICITFSQSLIKKFLGNYGLIHNINENHQMGMKVTAKNISLVDIAYVSGARGELNGSIRHADNTFIKLIDKPNLKDISTEESLTGFIKNMAWSYENECRLLIELDNSYSDKIAIGLPDVKENDMVVTFGPWANEDLKKEVKQAVKLKGFKDIGYKNSSFEGLVQYRMLCDYCNQPQFIRKYNSNGLFYK